MVKFNTADARKRQNRGNLALSVEQIKHDTITQVIYGFGFELMFNLKIVNTNITSKYA